MTNMNDELISQVIRIIDKNFDHIPMDQTTEILKVRREIRELLSASSSETPNSSGDVPDTNRDKATVTIGRTRGETAAEGGRMNNLDEAIKNTAYILDCLMAYRNIIETGDCNRCKSKNRDCSYVPKVGQMVRYNCPFYQPKEGGE